MSALDELERLSRLRDQGNLSEDEFKLLKARLRRLGYDFTMTAEEFNRLQGMSVRSGPRGAGLSSADLTWIEQKLAADPDYFKKLTTRGYMTDSLRDAFLTKSARPQEGFINGLDAESAAATA